MGCTDQLPVLCSVGDGNLVAIDLSGCRTADHSEVGPKDEGIDPL